MCDAETSTVFTHLPLFHNASEQIKTLAVLGACSSVMNVTDLFGKAFSAFNYDLRKTMSLINSTYRRDIADLECNVEAAMMECHELERILQSEAVTWLQVLLEFLNAFFELVIEQMEQNDSSNTGYVN